MAIVFAIFSLISFSFSALWEYPVFTVQINVRASNIFFISFGNVIFENKITLKNPALHSRAYNILLNQYW
jgi:hypothetical protein